MQISFEKIINQLDLALDQLALCDENSDRFALILIDNVMQIILREHHYDHYLFNTPLDKLTSGKGKYAKPFRSEFGDALKIAESDGLISHDVMQRIFYLRELRNASSHEWISHTGAIHALTIFYFKTVCEFLQRYCRFLRYNRPAFPSMEIPTPYRATKYLGSLQLLSGANPNYEKYYAVAWKQLLEVADHLSADLLYDLIADMSQTIKSIDEGIDLLVALSYPKRDRNGVVKNVQAEAFAFSAKGKKYAEKLVAKKQIANSASLLWDLSDYVVDKRKWVVPGDPIPEWEEELRLLKIEEDQHAAVDKYRVFMKETEEIRELISQSAEKYSDLDI